MSSLTSRELSDSLTLFELPRGRQIAVSVLKRLLPTVEDALFFGKVYRLRVDKLSQLIAILFRTPLVEALTEGDHSTELQDYILETIPTETLQGQTVTYKVEPPKAELLAQLFEAAEIVVAKSIENVAEKLADSLALMPNNTGEMLFESMARMNRMRPVIGTYEASIQYHAQDKVLVILDVSGSMSSSTIEAIVDDVVAMSYKVNATLAIVSSNTYSWAPGTYDTATILATAEYMSTVYETLTPLFEEDWDTVVTIADYDSSHGAKHAIGQSEGQVGRVLDISLVGCPTYLAECVGQLAESVESLLVATPHMRF